MGRIEMRLGPPPQRTLLPTAGVPGRLPGARPDASTLGQKGCRGVHTGAQDTGPRDCAMNQLLARCPASHVAAGTAAAHCCPRLVGPFDEKPLQPMRPHLLLDLVPDHPAAHERERQHKSAQVRAPAGTAAAPPLQPGTHRPAAQQDHKRAGLLRQAAGISKQLCRTCAQLSAACCTPQQRAAAGPLCHAYSRHAAAAWQKHRACPPRTAQRGLTESSHRHPDPPLGSQPAPTIWNRGAVRVTPACWRQRGAGMAATASAAGPAHGASVTM